MKNKLIISVILSLLILITIFFFINKKDVKFAPQIKNNNSLIFNKTNKSYLDTLLFVGLDIIKVDSLSVVIRDLNNKKIDDNIDVEGYIVNKNKQYVLYIKQNVDKEDALNIIAHELVHIKQYDDKSLIDSNNVIIYNKITYGKNELYLINYFNRPWEIEAFDKQEDIKKQLTEKLLL